MVVVAAVVAVLVVGTVVQHCLEAVVHFYNGRLLFQPCKGKDQQAPGSAAPKSLPPTLLPQTTGVSAGTGQRATSSVMALVHGENLCGQRIHHIMTC